MYMGGNRDPNGYGCGIIVVILMVILLVSGCTAVVQFFTDPFTR